MYKITYEDGTALRTDSLAEIIKDAIENFTFTKEHIGFKDAHEIATSRIVEIITEGETTIEIFHGTIYASRVGISYMDMHAQVWLREWHE